MFIFNIVTSIPMKLINMKDPSHPVNVTNTTGVCEEGMSKFKYGIAKSVHTSFEKYWNVHNVVWKLAVKGKDRIDMELCMELSAHTMSLAVKWAQYVVDTVLTENDMVDIHRTDDVPLEMDYVVVR